MVYSEDWKSSGTQLGQRLGTVLETHWVQIRMQGVQGLVVVN